MSVGVLLMTELRGVEVLGGVGLVEVLEGVRVLVHVILLLRHIVTLRSLPLILVGWHKIGVSVVLSGELGLEILR